MSPKIKKAKSPGHYTVVYAREVPYFKIMKQFVRLTRFGKAHEDIPYHVNSAKNPYPFWHPKARVRSADRLRHRDIAGHLDGSIPIFIVNSPHTRVHEITLDIDDADGAYPCDGLAAAEVLINAVVPPSFPTFVEPSRHGKGAYVRMLIARQSKPQLFNRVLMDVCKRLQERFNRGLIERFNAKLCGIKGTVWHRIENPKFEPSLYEAIGADYEVKRRTYSESFEPDLRLEQFRVNRGVLVTAACYGCFRSGKDDGRYASYLNWAVYKPDKKVISEKHFARWLKSCTPSTAKEVEKMEGAAETLTNSICITDITSVAPHRQTKINLPSGDSGAYDRLVNCYFRLCRRLGRAGTDQELRTSYVEEKLYSEPLINNDRDVRINQVVSKYGPWFDPTKCRPRGWKDRQKTLLGLVESTVLPKHRLGLKYTSEVDEVDLAIVLYAIENKCFENTADPDQRYSVPNGFLKETFRMLATKSAVGKRGANRNKLSAIKQVLAAAGLINCLDARWIPRSLSTRNKGVGKKYGLGPAHPRHSEFQKLLERFPAVKLGRKPAGA